MHPKLSVIIPTLDRPEILIHTVAAYISVKNPQLEIIVSDNHSESETKKVLQPFIDDRQITYIRTPQRLSMPDHFEFALPYAQGDYIMYNCDDDIILAPGFVPDVLQLLSTKEVEMLTWKIGLYMHPDWYVKTNAGVLYLSRLASGYLLKVNPLLVMQKFASIRSDFFPHLGALIFSRNLAHRIKNKYGTLFWPNSPDYTAPCLMLTEVNHWLYIDCFLGYGGRSTASNVAAYEKKSDKALTKRLKDFEADFKNKDPFPHHGLKVFSYTNCVFASYFLAKHLCPDFFNKNPSPFDYRQFAMCVLREIHQIDSNQPLVQPGDQAALHQWLIQEGEGPIWEEVLSKALTAPRNHLSTEGKRDPSGITFPSNDRIEMHCPSFEILNSFQLAQAFPQFTWHASYFSLKKIKDALERGLLSFTTSHPERFGRKIQKPNFLSRLLKKPPSFHHKKFRKNANIFEG